MKIITSAHKRSRFWLVVQDYHGEPCHPVVVCTSFQHCRELCKRGVDLESSVFIGLPARGDVEAVCNVAQLELPEAW